MARSLAAASTQYLERAAAVVSAYPLSVACWGLSTSSTLAQTAVSIGLSSDDSPLCHLGFRGDVPGDPIRWQMRGNAGSPATVETTTGYTANTWTHLCGRSGSATTHSVLINGGSKGTDATSITFPTVNRTAIGRLTRPTAGNYMSGRIAWAAIWNVLLTDAQVLALYNGGVAIPPWEVAPLGLVAVWPLMDNDGDIDVWGSNHMTAVNSPTYGSHPAFMESLYVPGWKASGGAKEGEITDGAKFGDSAVGLRSRIGSIADGFKSGDSFLGLRNRLGLVFDGSKYSDAVYGLSSRIVVVSEGSILSDVEAGLRSRLTSTSEGSKLSDTPTALRNRVGTVTEGNLETDSFQGFRDLVVSFSEGIKLSESFAEASAVLPAHGQIFIDGITLSPSLNLNTRIKPSVRISDLEINPNE